MTETLDDLKDELEEAATDESLSAADRLARLREIREELVEATSEADRHIKEAEAAENAGAVGAALAVAALRERASLHDELIEQGVLTEADFEAHGVLTHAQLDAMDEEGLLEAAALELVASGKLVVEAPA